ncbi:MAG: three-Cys-motif partner protein TcmP [Defluviitaleaceae bacterium]|nr:three-Cys-motif partner protein TcmP [Defluviitaleaceae bacterium]
MLYVDCFAGAGKFEDGELGSPSIAIECLEKSFALRKDEGSLAPKVYMKFIELNHAQDLIGNLTQQPKGRCEVISGKFEDKIIPLLQNIINEHPKGLNVFLYVDPWGVKVLNAELFDAVADVFDSSELLINLNSFGFFRDACRAMKVTRFDNEATIFENILGDIEEYDSSAMDSVDELNAVAGGDYWQVIVNNYGNGSIDGYQAEKEFSEQYKLRLRQKYKYVLDMPIRLKSGQHPKYRMVHACNHPDGCKLMAENIAKRTDRLVVDVQSGGQLSLFEQTADNEVADDVLLEKNVRELLSKTTDFVRLNEFLAIFYNEFGVLCDVPRLSSGKSGSILKTLEKSGDIIVARSPELTGKNQPTKFWAESKDKTLSLKGK